MHNRSFATLSSVLRQHSSHLRSPAYVTALRCRFSTSPRCAAARVYQPVRSPGDLETLLLVNASSRTALVTLWTASWCRTCKAVEPTVRAAVEAYAGPKDVAYVEVEYDAPGNEELGNRYMITSIPTLLAFSRSEAQMGTRVTDAKKMNDAVFLKEWIKTEAERGGEGGAGGEGWLGKVMDTIRGGR